MDIYYKAGYPENDEVGQTAFNSMIFPISPINDKLKRYLNDPIIIGDSKFSLVGFWNLILYGSLDAFARDVSSIPATSCGVERLFSSCKDMDDYKRRNLSPDKKGALQTARSWIILNSELHFYEEFYYFV